MVVVKAHTFVSVCVFVFVSSVRACAWRPEINPRAGGGAEEGASSITFHLFCLFCVFKTKFLFIVLAVLELTV